MQLIPHKKSDSEGEGQALASWHMYLVIRSVISWSSVEHDSNRQQGVCEGISSMQLYVVFSDEQNGTPMVGEETSGGPGPV